MVVRIGPGPEPGWLVAAVGVGLTVVGWYQISGQPTEAQQLPYLASATIPGAALIVAGVVLVAARRISGSGAAAAQAVKSDSAKSGTGESGTADSTRLWALPSGSYVHRRDCPLLDGKTAAFEITEQLRGDGAVPIRPCPICDPEPVASHVAK